MEDAAAGGLGRKPSDEPGRNRNRQSGAAGHQQEAHAPAVMGLGQKLRHFPVVVQLLVFS